jgi:predicted amidohydrolase YtcJ
MAVRDEAGEEVAGKMRDERPLWKVPTEVIEESIWRWSREFGVSRRRFLQLLAASGAGLLLNVGRPPRVTAAPIDRHPRLLASEVPEILLVNGRIWTGDRRLPWAEALAVRGDRVLAVGGMSEVRSLLRSKPTVIDVRGRTVVPGLNDAHIHTLREGVIWRGQTRWDDVSSLGEALDRIRAQTRRVPPGTWIWNIGGWHPNQFRERRFPTREELDAAAPQHPVYVQYRVGPAVVNSVALRVAGIGPETPDPAGGRIERRPGSGEPNGVLHGAAMGLARRLIPRPTLEEQLDGLRLQHEALNRLGLTSVVDEPGSDTTPDLMYPAIHELWRRGQMTLRVAYHVHSPSPDVDEVPFTAQLVAFRHHYEGDAWLRFVGSGEVLTWEAWDPGFVAPLRRDPRTMERWKQVVRLLLRNRMRFSYHAVHDDTITQALNFLEEIAREVPLAPLRITFEHVEDISEYNIRRAVRLGIGFGVQNRLSWDTPELLRNWGGEKARHTPPLRLMLGLGAKVAAGTDAIRVNNYNPWVSLYWFVTGKDITGEPTRVPSQLLTRVEALRLYTAGGAWVTGEERSKGVLAPGYLADLAVLSEDYFSVAEERIPTIRSVLTMVGGRVVYLDQGAGVRIYESR